ncbi:hypothetical protein [Pseudomonas sp. OST1909]|uniref:hypothetical protein n=1 Tax=Pseudomonas sp. OST1909 TaxID=2777367 RepID=UPI001888E165|nr:hypothetical protein [Pseudomonas sp. OST1909]QOY69541.1 hypothetical protein IH404_17215 [Pseudomonas sp. OST1909]
MSNPFNPLDWLNSTQEWFTKAERSSGFRPYLIFVMMSFVAGISLLVAFPERQTIEIAGLTLMLGSAASFIPLYYFKAVKDPDFCRSETHVQEVKKIELEMMGSESKPIKGEILEHKALTESISEPLQIDSVAREVQQ